MVWLQVNFLLSIPLSRICNVIYPQAKELCSNIAQIKINISDYRVPVSMPSSIDEVRGDIR